jgi:hypothetical protein
MPNRIGGGEPEVYRGSDVCDLDVVPTRGTSLSKRHKILSDCALTGSG